MKRCAALCLILTVCLVLSSCQQGISQKALLCGELVDFQVVFEEPFMQFVVPVLFAKKAQAVALGQLNTFENRDLSWRIIGQLGEAGGREVGGRWLYEFVVEIDRVTQPVKITSVTWEADGQTYEMPMERFDLISTEDNDYDSISELNIPITIASYDKTSCDWQLRAKKPLTLNTAAFTRPIELTKLTVNDRDADKNAIQADFAANDVIVLETWQAAGDPGFEYPRRCFSLVLTYTLDGEDTPRQYVLPRTYIDASQEKMDAYILALLNRK